MRVWVSEWESLRKRENVWVCGWEKEKGEVSQRESVVVAKVKTSYFSLLPVSRWKSRVPLFSVLVAFELCRVLPQDEFEFAVGCCANEKNEAEAETDLKPISSSFISFIKVTKLEKPHCWSFFDFSLYVRHRRRIQYHRFEKYSYKWWYFNLHTSKLNGLPKA